MNSSTIRKAAAILCVCTLGMNMAAPFRDLSAAASNVAVSNHEDPERFRNRNSEIAAESVQNPWELVHDPRFDGCEKLDCIDVSSHQGNVDWTAVAAEGVQAAVIRLGYRGYESGNLNEDKNFRTNLEGAYQAGLRVGVYFYTQALNVQEAVDEANFVLDTLDQMQTITLTLPIFFDIEKIDYDNGRMDAMHFSPEEHTALCEAFCSTIAAKGYQTGVYSNKNFMVNDLQMSSLEQYHVWLANYTSQTTYTGKYDYWQYTQSSYVNGVSGAVDRSVIYLTDGNTLSPAETRKAEETLTAAETAVSETVSEFVLPTLAPGEIITPISESATDPVFILPTEASTENITPISGSATDPTFILSTEAPTGNITPIIQPVTDPTEAPQTTTYPTFILPTEAPTGNITPIIQPVTDPTEAPQTTTYPTFVLPTEAPTENITPIIQPLTDPTEAPQTTTYPTFVLPTEAPTENITPIIQPVTEPTEAPQTTTYPTFVLPTEAVTETNTELTLPTFAVPTEESTGFFVTPIEEPVTESASGEVHRISNCQQIVLCSIGEQELYTGQTFEGVPLTSSNPQIFTVDEKGLITAAGSGTASLLSGGIRLCDVKVTPSVPELGDCNCDGSINAVDATQILRYASSMGTGTAPGLSRSHYRLYDRNLDGSINAADASDVLRYSAAKGVGR